MEIEIVSLKERKNLANDGWFTYLHHFIETFNVQCLTRYYTGNYVPN